MRRARVYDDVDGYRILVDRLWPRGVARADGRVDAWERDLAPSTELRRDFHAGLSHEEFEARYRAELEDKDLTVLDRPDAVLVTAARNEPNHVDVLLRVLEERGA